MLSSFLRINGRVVSVYIIFSGLPEKLKRKGRETRRQLEKKKTAIDITFTYEDAIPQNRNR
jgi:hypothetical protein